MRSVLKISALATVAALSFVACSSDDESSSGQDASERTTTTVVEEEAGTIVDVAVGADDFSTLVTAVQQAGLAETLSGPGPFTVFAPTDDAFAQIPEDQLNAILADEQQLTAILTYHVLPGEVRSTDLEPTQTVETVQGATVDIQVGDGGATINGCNIVDTDIEASNGVIHVIDCVITPPSA